MSKNIPRLYKMRDAVLIHTLCLKLNLAERDEAEFANYGFSPTDRQAIEAACNAFADFPDDIELLANYMEAIEEKNKAKKELKTATRQMMQRVANRYGRHRARYRKYRIKNINKMTNLELEIRGERTAHYLRNDLSDLASEGLTLAMVDAYKVLADNFIATSADAVDRMGDRFVYSEDRVLMGNALYKQFIKLCEIGQIIWKDYSEARYNDYLWYKEAIK